jgi:hypothetical protein
MYLFILILALGVYAFFTVLALANNGTILWPSSG